MAHPGHGHHHFQHLWCGDPTAQLLEGDRHGCAGTGNATASMPRAVLLRSMREACVWCDVCAVIVRLAQYIACLLTVDWFRMGPSVIWCGCCLVCWDLHHCEIRLGGGGEEACVVENIDCGVRVAISIRRNSLSGGFCIVPSVWIPLCGF